MLTLSSTDLIPYNIFKQLISSNVSHVWKSPPRQQESAGRGPEEHKHPQAQASLWLDYFPTEIQQPQSLRFEV